MLLTLACQDESLDPLQTDAVKKGKILALRGTQLQNIYFDGVPGAQFFPRIISGSEKFEFDAEYLAEDPTTLESFDIYVIKRVKVGNTTTKERVFLTNIPGSQFKTTSDYTRPWVSVSLKLTDILAKIGITDYSDPDAVQTLLTTYQTGIGIESDLNLKDGSKVLAADIVAAGLFQSNQFYPAQVLTYTVTDFCSYDNSSWAGTYAATEVYSNSAYGPYNVKFTKDPDDPNRFNMTNFWDSGISAYVVFKDSENDPDKQIVEFPEQDDGDGGTIEGTGTYDECKKTFKIQTKYAGYEWRYEFVLQE